MDKKKENKMNRLMKYLSENGITQAHMIRQLGISQMTWYNYKTKRTKMPKAVKLAISYVLNKSFDDLFMDD
jgi:DNA-binding XRE family transcriptional regulator|tara:strand:- start:5490 stop:5702 length:213 start_codon:yes stop_codon:yes gene_type:complete